MSNLQEIINNINNKKLTINEYNKILSIASSKYEMSSIVFIYEHMKNNNIELNEESYKIINRLHSKTVKENDTIILPFDDKKRLEPRRRIHKIMKGKLMSEKYSDAKQYIDKVQELIKNYNYDGDKIKLAKFISKGINVDIKFAKVIVTVLKRNKLINKVDNSYHLEL